MLDPVDLNVVAEDRVDDIVEPVGVSYLRVQGHLHPFWTLRLETQQNTTQSQYTRIPEASLTYADFTISV